MGNFNVGLLKYTTDTSTAQFLDQMYSSSLLPQITPPNHISTKSKTLIDNIFSTDSPKEPILGNIITSISDHLAQFLLFPIEKTKDTKKKEIYKRNFKSLAGNELIKDLRSIDWNKALRLNQNQTNKFFKLFFHIFETFLDTYAPLKKLSNSEMKLLSKPWITHEIMTSIKIKDKIYKKLLKSKNSQQNERLYSDFKRFRDRINILTRNSKANHYQNFFQEHKQNMLKTWEGIKSIININTTKNKSINCLNVNNTEEMDPFVLSSSFNKFFTTIGKKIEANIVHTSENCTDYLTNPSEKTFFLTPTLPDEIEDIITTLNLTKSIGPNSIPTKLFKKYFKTISILISKLINQSLVTGIFPEP